jgi:SAM-dependent methyltransferase
MMALRDSLYQVYWWLEPRIAPGLRYAQLAYEDVLFASVGPGVEWLDLGCGHSLLPEWRGERVQQLIRIPKRLVGLDPVHAALKQHGTIRLLVCGDGVRLPFPDSMFDLVTANMVVEHLADPETQFREVSRILKPGGRFVFHTPNGDGYPTRMARMAPDVVRGLAAKLLEGRSDDDTPARIEQLAGSAGLAVERIDLVRSTAMFAMIAPLAIAELLWLRALAASSLRRFRPNLIAVLTKGFAAPA